MAPQNGQAEMMPWTISPDPYRLSLGSPSSPVAIFVGQRTAYGVDLGQQSLVRSHGFQVFWGVFYCCFLLGIDCIAMKRVMLVLAHIWCPTVDNGH